MKKGNCVPKTRWSLTHVIHDAFAHDEDERMTAIPAALRRIQLQQDNWQISVSACGHVSAAGLVPDRGSPQSERTSPLMSAPALPVFFGTRKKRRTLTLGGTEALAVKGQASPNTGNRVETSGLEGREAAKVPAMSRQDPAFVGSGGWDRTNDQLINSQLLYR